MMKDETIARRIRELEFDVKDLKGIVKQLVAESLQKNSRR